MRAWKGHITAYKNTGREWYEHHEYGLLVEVAGGTLQVSAPVAAEANMKIKTVVPAMPQLLAYGTPLDVTPDPDPGRVSLITSLTATTIALPKGLLALFPALAGDRLPPDTVTVEVVAGEGETPATTTTEAATGTATGGQEETPTKTSEAPAATGEAGGEGGVPAAALAGALIALLAAALLLLKRR